MNYENVKLIAGDPDKIGRKIEEALAAHPNAQIISTAVSSRLISVEEDAQDGRSGGAGSSSTSSGGANTSKKKKVTKEVITALVTIATVS